MPERLRAGARLTAVENCPECLQRLVAVADGDARRALNLLEIAADLAQPQADGSHQSRRRCCTRCCRRTGGVSDKGATSSTDMISAFHKSVRGSSPDGALYWYCRMLDGGADPLYVARRLVAIASEDIGNADPRAMQVALAAWDAFQRVGPAEGERAIAQAAIYCACAPKSNAVYKAFSQCLAQVRSEGSHPVPEHLRNAPTGLMKSLATVGNTAMRTMNRRRMRPGRATCRKPGRATLV